MGIQGLLKLLGPVTIPEHISSFHDQTAAIDIMSWLYKGCYRCAYEHNQNIETNAFLYYILEMLQILDFYKIKPIVVFDGRYVGKKDETIEKRKKQKEENKQKGLQQLEKGNQEQAKKFLSRCIVIDDRIITTTMNALYSKGIQFMVAPYESDSQIAKLVHLGVADFAITEDSDLLIYNTRVVLKLTQDGECAFIDLNKWQPQDVDTIYLKAFLKMTPQQRIDAAVMAGSDYNSSIKGIGIKRAIKHLAQHQSLNKVIQVLRNNKKYSELIPQNYQNKVMQSKLIFIFATIYNPFNKCLQFLNPHLIDEFKPQNIDIEELKRLVGPFYAYNEQMKMGRINVRNMQVRQVSKIDIREALSVNTYNLQVRANGNIKRKQFLEAQRRKRQEQKANIPEIDDAELWKRVGQKKKEKIVVPVVELTAEEKKRQSQLRKAQKVKRFNEFKNFLSTFTIQQSSDSDSESQSLREPQTPKEKIIKVEKKKEAPKMIQKKSDAMTTNAKSSRQEFNEDSSQSQMNEHLMALNPCNNPWAKK